MSPSIPLRPLGVFAVLLVLTALGFGALPASADDGGLFASVKFGNTDFEVDVRDSFDAILDGDDDSLGFEVGYEFLGFLAIQAGYHDLGSFDPISTCPECLAGSGLDLTVPLEVDTVAYSVAAKAEITVLPLLSIFGKFGLARVESELVSEVAGVTGTLSDTSEDETLIGAGLRVKLIPSRLSLFGEWERIGDDIETASLGATIHF